MNEKRIFYFDEDMIGIPMFTPIENHKIFQKYIDSYEDQIKRGYIEFPEEKITLKERKIKFEEIDNMLKKILEPYDEVRFEVSPEEVENDSFAYGNDDIFILGIFDLKQDKKIITNLSFYKGFDVRKKNFIEKFSIIMAKFCKDKRLILFDDFLPNDQKIIKAYDLEEFRKYILIPWQSFSL